MRPLDWLLLIFLGVLFALALCYCLRHKGCSGCCGDCTKCKKRNH